MVDYLLVAVFTSLVLLLTFAFFYFSSKEKKEFFVLFIDAPDPDNPAAAAAIYKHILLSAAAPPLSSNKSSHHLHIVLSGRPVDLRTPKPSSGNTTSGIIRQKWERSDPFHAKKVMEDAASRIENYLMKSNIARKHVTIYDGGVPPIAPLSDAVHDWDFLFDRKDLITFIETDQGEILSPEEYQMLVSEFSALSTEERERKMLSILRPYSFCSLSSLRKNLSSNTCSSVTVFLGGPATALVQLFQGEKQSNIRRKVCSLYGMFGSLQPGKQTLLLNQFNVACDIEAASKLFIDNMFPLAKKYLIMTETAKNDVLMVSSRDIQDMDVPSYFADLQRLWESTHRGKVQPMFDVLPVMAYTESHLFSWCRKKALIYEWKKGREEEDQQQQVFGFVDSDNVKHVLVSEESLPAIPDKVKFLKFMHKTWN